MKHISELVAGFIQHCPLDDLDRYLVDTRRKATKEWPYAGTNDAVRMVEAEYRRRGVPLPEDRVEQ